MSAYYPIQLNIAGKRCVVIGGGEVAARKVVALRAAGGQVRVVSPELTAALEAQAAKGEIEAIRERYGVAHLEGAVLVFAATNDRHVNAKVAADAQHLGLPVNVADSPEESSFVVPAVVRRGDFCLSLSTGGHSPLLAARLCDELESRFGPEYGPLVELLGQMRAYIKTRSQDSARRRCALARLVDAESELRTHLRSGHPEAARAQAETIVATALDAEREA
jgi:siroheme synthase-like protein